MSKKVLVVLTNTARYPSLKRATGLWLGEAVHFVAVIEKAGYPLITPVIVLNADQFDTVDPVALGPGGAVAYPPTHTLRPNLHHRPGAASFVKFWSK